MKHPTEFLTAGWLLTPDTWRELQQNATSATPGPGEGETTFLFSREAICDSQDRIIITDAGTNSFRCLPRECCACSNDPLDCECHETRCHRCGEEFAAMNSSCDSILCVNDKCPLCRHYREECAYQELRDDVCFQAIMVIAQQQGASAAEACVSAVAKVIAPGVGEAPVFPATIRMLDEIMRTKHDIGKVIQNKGRGLEWTCPDGSLILHDSNNLGWLTWKGPARG